MYLFFPLIAGFVNAIVTIILQYYSQNISAAQNSYWFAVGLTCLTGFIISNMVEVNSFTLREYLLLPVLGFLISASQACFSLGCTYEKNPGIVTPLISSNILFTFILDILINKRLVTFYDILGAFVVFISVSFLAVFREVKSPPSTGNTNNNQQAQQEFDDDSSELEFIDGGNANASIRLENRAIR